MRMSLVVYLIFNKPKFSETSIIFLELTIKLITECVICKSNDNFYQNDTGVYFLSAFQKRSVP